MKVFRFVLSLVAVTAVILIFVAPNSDSIRSYLTSLWGNNKLLNSFEGNVLFPPPLRSALNDRGGELSKSGTLEWTNFQRKQHKLPELSGNSILDQAAANKLADMFERQYFEHVSPTGKGPADLAKSVGYAYVLVGENLALGNFASDQALVQAWMDSPGHRANVLNTRYQEIGIAVGKGMFEGTEQWLAVQSFGLPLSACPQVDAGLKSELDNNEREISNLQVQLAALKAEIENDDRNNTKAYNDKVNQYNALVERVNSLIDQTKRLVQRYNEQVNVFNECLKE